MWMEETIRITSFVQKIYLAHLAPNPGPRAEGASHLAPCFGAAVRGEHRRAAAESDSVAQDTCSFAYGHVRISMNN